MVKLVIAELLEALYQRQMSGLAGRVVPRWHGDTQRRVRCQLRADVGEEAGDNVVAITDNFRQFLGCGRRRKGLPEVGFADDGSEVCAVWPVVRGGIGLMNVNDTANRAAGRGEG